MTPLRQRMTDNMTVRGLAENTKKSYLNSVAGLARYYRRSPDRISAPEVQDYLLHLHELTLLPDPGAGGKLKSDLEGRDDKADEAAIFPGIQGTVGCPAVGGGCDA